MTEAFRRAVLRLFVRLSLFDADQAAGMLTCPHSGFHSATGIATTLGRTALRTMMQRFDDRLGIARRQTQQRQRRTIGRATTLLPVWQRRYAHPDHQRKLHLGVS